MTHLLNGLWRVDPQMTRFLIVRVQPALFHAGFESCYRVVLKLTGLAVTYTPLIKMIYILI